MKARVDVLPLNKLYYIYGLDTSCFYYDDEYELEKRLIKARCLKRKFKDIDKMRYSPKVLKTKLKNKEIDKKEFERLQIEWCTHKKEHYKKLRQVVNKYIGDKKQELKSLLNERNQLGQVRVARHDKIFYKEGQPSLQRRVSVFDGNLTRCLGMKEREFNEQMIIVKVYFFEVANSILKNGFMLNGRKYVFFSASAGQIRTKKFVAIREDLLMENWNTLTAGLTVEKINSLGGMNINKYLAYLALCNSGTDVWEDFDIDRCIVVDDFETNVAGVVDYIDDKTFEIERVTRELPIAQMDGCGIMLPSVSKVNFMVRPPWIKGLLSPFDFMKFIKDNNAVPIVKDIYGDEHNIIEEDIRIIFTKSQFKMWKYYRNWQEYKDNFKKYNCTAGICNKEEKFFDDSVTSYQMIQTLIDLTDDEINILAQENVKNIDNIVNDKTTMLKAFGVVDKKPNYLLSDFQKCLKLYPELLQDLYCRQTLKDIKNKFEKDLWSGRFKIKGKYTFVVPDLYAFCEWLFLGIKKPKGLLQDGEVCCRLFDEGKELDCLRSPHLYCEHPIRKNRYIDWFKTNAIYISSHDYISRIIQCDM